MKLDTSAIAAALGIPQQHIPLLIAAFQEEAVGLLENLLGAIKAGDMEGVAQNAHSIKGSAANLRIENVSHMALEIERAGKASDPSFDYGSAFTALKSEIDAIEI